MRCRFKLRHLFFPFSHFPVQLNQNLFKTAIFCPVTSDVPAVGIIKSAIFWCVYVFFVAPCSLQKFTEVADKPVERQYISTTLQDALCYYDLDLTPICS